MKNYFLYVFISLFLFSLSSCKDDKDVVAVLELGLENADFYKEAGSVVIDVKSLPADWTASVDVEAEQWCKTEPVNSGAGVKMGLGMRLHQKVMRMISLSTFGIVLLKLVFDDLWAMPTIGKIIVFIILGLILLILSFLYQKLKDVLFKNDEDEVS